MHAVLHQSFKEFVENHHSREVYLRMLDEAGYEETRFEADHYHNDAELDDLIAAASKLLAQGRMDFLSDMGLFGAASLLEQFKAFCEPDWDILDLLENIEPRMHKFVSEEMGAFPPALKVERIGDNELTIDVRSHRKMAGLAKGFINGFARAYGDTITIEVDASDTGYRFAVKRIPDGAPQSETAG